MGGAGGQKQPELLVAAAADLAPLEGELTAAFQQVAGSRVRFVFGASGVLTRQIQAGAPYDVILSANTAYIKDLQGRGRVLPDTVTVYAVGRLGVWSKKGVHWADLEKANSLEHLAIANPAHAPYGLAAEQALRRAGWWERLRPKLVFGENVRQALQFAQTGNADAAITAWSLVQPLGGELVDDRLHAPIEQGAAVVAASGQVERARRFVKFLTSESGRQILARYGLGVPGAPPR